MKVVIVGGGIAGRTCAAFLSRLPDNCVSQITVLEAAPSTRAKSPHRKALPLYTGLWSPALTELHERLNITNPIFEDHRPLIDSLQFVGKSGYRSVSGDWLARPERGLQPFRCQAGRNLSLGFVKNGTLLSWLKDHLDAVDDLVDMQFNQVVTKLERGDGGEVIVHTSNGNSYEASLVIAADGVDSSLRSLVSINQPIAELPAEYSQAEAFRDTLQYRGYDVYRGLCPWGNYTLHGVTDMQDLYHYSHYFTAFQTWGKGLRFAAVPTIEGIAWFAAVTNKNIVLPAAAPHPHGPFVNWNLHNVDADHLKRLKCSLRDWHDPVGRILSGTDDSTVCVCPAIAFRRPKKDFEYSKDCHWPVVFVGDAAHTLDPILAQGAGLAIEDAGHLTDAIHEKSSLYKDGLNNTILPNIMETYWQRRASRVQRLHYVSNLAQAIGHVESGAVMNCRDAAMKLIPHSIKGAVFDYFLRFVTT